MKKMIAALALAGLTVGGLSFFTTARAQPNNGGMATPEATAAPVDPAAQAAAIQLLEAMNTQQTMEVSITTLLDAQVKQNPQMAQVRPDMEEFFKKYMSYDAVKDELAGVYASEFTVQELNELTAFYKTPTGMKLASKLPVLTTKGAEISQKHVQDHMQELTATIMKKMQGAGGGMR